MGLLGNIYSTIDTQKRKLADLLGNPIESVQQAIGYANDRARAFNELGEKASQEFRQTGDAFGPYGRQQAQILADAYNPIGMMVYHGSPAKFSKFDPTKIGSGEGAQAFGYGHYVAQSPSVAKDYQRRLAKESQATDLNTKMNLVDIGGKPLSSFNVDMDSALIDAAKAGKKDFVDLASAKKARWETLSADETYPFRDYAQQKVSGYQSLLDTAKKSDVDYTGSGILYEIDLPDEQIAKMLDWDKPLSKQPKEVKDAMAKLGITVDEKKVAEYSDALLAALEGTGSANLPRQPLDMTGEQIIREIRRNPSRYFGAMEGRAQTAAMINPDVGASELLRQSGIPGIRYLDQGSRGVGEGTSNFVVFPGGEDLLTILKRNGGLLD